MNRFRRTWQVDATLPGMLDWRRVVGYLDSRGRLSHMLCSRGSRISRLKSSSQLSVSGFQKMVRGTHPTAYRLRSWLRSRGSRFKDR